MRLLTSIGQGSGLLGVLVLIGLRPVKTSSPVLTARTPLSLLKEGFGLFSSADMLLMLTICFYSGFELSYARRTHSTEATQTRALLGFATTRTDWTHKHSQTDRRIGASLSH